MRRRLRRPRRRLSSEVAAGRHEAIPSGQEADRAVVAQRSTRAIFQRAIHGERAARGLGCEHGTFPAPGRELRIRSGRQMSALVPIPVKSDVT